MNREIICADATEWLRQNRDVGSVITSLPDMEEIGQTNSELYLNWFRDAAKQCFKSASRGHPIIFYQTDRLIDGRRLSKFNALMTAANSLNGYELVWHKIVLRRDAGKTDLRRPGYSHLICFGDHKVRPGRPTPDVMHAGKLLYPNGTSVTAATTALQTALRHGTTVTDPFCGRGTIPALAEPMGFEKIIGVDIDRQQVEAAKALRLYKGGFFTRNKL
jgi:hypothetical protein